MQRTLSTSEFVLRDTPCTQGVHSVYTLCEILKSDPHFTTVTRDGELFRQYRWRRGGGWREQRRVKGKGGQFQTCGEGRSEASGGAAEARRVTVIRRGDRRKTKSQKLHAFVTPLLACDTRRDSGQGVECEELVCLFTDALAATGVPTA